jgi:hypothetical protein
MTLPTDTRAWPLPRWIASALLTILVAGAMAPLADPDLPMHLAVGRWIVEHRAVPTTEPFAWTRPGAPYFAYSWLLQAPMYLLMHAAGPLALRLLHGALLAGAFGSALIAGRMMGWPRSTTCLVAALQLIVVTSVSPLLRPQEALFILFALEWALVMRALTQEGGRRMVTLVSLALVAAITVNTHVFFPLLAAPLSLVLTLPREGIEDATARRMRQALPIAVALALGAACSPYTLDWPRVFALNFRQNVLFGQASLIAEHQSGFSRRLGLGVALSVLPLIASGSWSSRERALWGFTWLVGLVVFASKTKGLIVWWVLVFPLVGHAATVLHSWWPPLRKIPPLLAFAIPLSAAFGYLVGVPPTILPLRRAWQAERAVAGSTLSSPAALATDTLLTLLTASGSEKRVLTVFDLGSYLNWRAPSFSASIDGRTIFPDSAALPDAPVPPTSVERPLGPWRSADAAIVPMSYPVAGVLDTAHGWERIASTDALGSPFGPVGLWRNAAPDVPNRPARALAPRARRF